MALAEFIAARAFAFLSKRPFTLFLSNKFFWFANETDELKFDLGG
jgi:hypothetical protein